MILPPPSKRQEVTLDIDVALNYTANAPCAILMQIEASNRPGQLITRERFDLPPGVVRSDVTGQDGAGLRSWLDVTDRLDVRYKATAVIDRPRTDITDLPITPLKALPSEATLYLFSSRYCPADFFDDAIMATFHGLSGGAIVQAMSDWISENLTYDSRASGPRTDAIDTYGSRRGVCRDFAHLMIAFCRTVGIPARMVSAYAPEVDPPDFHAMTEVYLDGRWHMIDPTGMASADRAAIIGVGRDAADIAFLTAFGSIDLRHLRVHVTERTDQAGCAEISAG